MKETQLLSKLMLTGLKRNLRNPMTCNVTSNATSTALWTSHAGHSLSYVMVNYCLLRVAILFKYKGMLAS